MKHVLAVIFGLTVAIVISVVTDYSINDLEWWAAGLPILITGFLFEHFGNHKETVIPPRHKTGNC